MPGLGLCFSFEWSQYLALINVRIICVTQGRQCVGLTCFCGINSCIAFNRVVLKIIHCVFTEVCSVELCMSSSRIESFSFNSIPVSVPNNEYVAVRSILSIGSRIDFYVYYVVVGFSDRWDSCEMVEC